MATEAKYGGQDYTWSQLVKKVGVDRARVEAPELDPKYQQMVKQEGQAKGSQAYTEKYVDPQTVQNPYEAGMTYLKSRGGLLPTAEYDVANLLANKGPALLLGGVSGAAATSKGGLGRALVGGPAPDTTGGGKTTKPATTAQPAVNPFAQAEDALFSGLVNQYQSAMNIVNPYISGANAAQYATSAQNVGNAFAGGGVQTQNPNTAGIIGKDEAAYAAANQAGAQGIQNAIQAQGPANALALQASPYQSILAALTSEAQYKTETGAGTPALAGQTATAANPITDPYGAAVQMASESAGTGTAPGTSTVQGANAAVAPVNPNIYTPSTTTSASPGQAGGSS